MSSAQLENVGPMHADRVREHIAARAVLEDTEEAKPYGAQTVPKAELFGCVNRASMYRWLDALATEEEPPTEEQRSFLKAVIARVEIEALAEQHGRKEPSADDPLFDVIHGVPGAGKSKIIGWLRRLFEEELQWTHGVEFVCLAYQNAMAALINGYTMHHWTASQWDTPTARPRPATTTGSRRNASVSGSSSSTRSA